MTLLDTCKQSLQTLRDDCDKLVKCLQEASQADNIKDFQDSVGCADDMSIVLCADLFVLRQLAFGGEEIKESPKTDPVKEEVKAEPIKEEIKTDKRACALCGQVSGAIPGSKYCDKFIGGDPDGKNAHDWQTVKEDKIEALKEEIKNVISV